VLTGVTPTLDAQGHKEPIAWPTDFASTAVTTLTAEPETPGVEMVVRYHHKADAEPTAFASHHFSVQPTLIAMLATVNLKTIVKSMDLALTVKLHTPAALAPASMDLKAHVPDQEMLLTNLTATNKPSNVLPHAAPTLNVLVLKELTAWPTVFATPAETMPIAKLEMLGTEMVVKLVNKPSAELVVFASVLALTTSVETLETHLALEQHLTVTLMVFA